MADLAGALFTKSQRLLLGIFFVNVERSFYTNEILRLTGVGSGTIQRELQRLSAAGLLQVSWVGNQKHYQANPECPIYEELRGIVQKLYGGVRLRSSLSARSKG